MNTQDAQNFELKLTDKDKLVAAYMPFIKHGAFFVLTTKPFQLGEPITLQITLLDEATQYSFAGQVVWVTPAAAQGGMRAGIGVQLESNDGTKLFRAKVESALTGMIYTDHPTDTL